MRSLIVLALLLASCAAKPPPSTAEQACAARIDQDPAVRDVLAKSAETDWLWQNAGKVEIVKQQAMARCLRGRGAHVGGGVERPR